VLTLAASAPSFAAVEDGCRVPDSYLAMPRGLERTEQLVLNKKPVRVVVIGTPMWPISSSASPLERALESRLPGINFEIMQTLSLGLAQDDFEHIRALVREKAPDLLIWQVGTRDAMANSDVEKFEDTLGKASEWIESRGPDLILVDPPFVPHVRHERIYTPYIGEIGEMSRSEGVPVLRRYAAMQYLDAEADRFRIADDKRPRCVPELMAEAIVRAVGKK
jgi:acyl-CoA thioesterase-1